MDLFAFPPISATLDAAYALLMGLASLLQPITGGASAAVAVVVLTLLVRTILIPTGVAQAKADQTRARLAPKLQVLQRRHKNDRERLQRETMKLYADEKASPFAGCLPVLIQAPVVGIIYTLFLHAVIAGHPNNLLTEHLFGVPLGASLLGSIGGGIADVARRRSVRRRDPLDRGSRRDHPAGLASPTHRGSLYSGRRRDAPSGGCPAVRHGGRRHVRPARRRALPPRHGGVDARPTADPAEKVPAEPLVTT